ncbi:MAG: tyrosine-protein phosphatase [Niabella sp.]
MFGLFSKKKNDQIAVNFATIKTDMHSHLLPGIDDGAPDMDTSLHLIEGLKNIGYSKIITTPHIFWDMYKNTPDIVHKKLDEVHIAMKKKGLEIEIEAAAEYYLDEHVDDLLQKKEPLLTFHNNMVLVEFSVLHMSNNMKEVIFDLLMAGYQPVLAHPERYTYLNYNRDVFDELKANGCMFQLNLLSVAGGYGKSVKELATYFLKGNFYSLVGTDMHHTGHLERLKTFTAPPELHDLLSGQELLNPKL